VSGQFHFDVVVDADQRSALRYAPLRFQHVQRRE
jgi:hypothetical protein